MSGEAVPLQGRALHRAVDSRGLWLHGLVSGNVKRREEEFIIDPRKSGNDAQYLNHSCQPNSLLMTIQVRDCYIVKVLAITDIPAGTEATINFGRRSRSRLNGIKSNYMARHCVGYVWG